MNSLLPISQILDAAFAPTRELDGSPMTWHQTPRADILEGEKEYRIRLDMPGVTADELDISLEDQVLTLKADRQLELPEGFKAHRRELPSKVTMRRSFDLGRAVESDRITANLEHGVLTITLPKSERNLPRRISVK
jgi:HSP20 family protein